MIESLLAGSPALVLALAACAGAVAVALLVHWLLFRVLRRIAPRTRTVLDAAFAEYCAAPSRLALPLVALHLLLPALGLAPRAALVAGRILTVALILAIAWFFVRVTRVVQAGLLERFDVGTADNLRARKVHTQIDIARKIVVVGIAVIALAAVLMSFDRLQEIGAGILASAGLAGLALGFAAQRTLGNLLAGFQIAITQPIRLDDVVVVEDEWGRIEEITLTYVIVRIWDQRRLVLPISYFIEKPFQNWTRVDAEILGTVFLYVDYRVPVESVRQMLGEVVEASPQWDGRVWRLHVTEAGERTVELRALMSAADSPTAWELRCGVREEMLRRLNEELPDGLPRVRAELDRAPEALSGDPPEEAA